MDFSIATEFGVCPYLDLFSSDGVHLCLLPNGKFVDHYLLASSDSDFEVIAILLNLRDALELFDLFDDFIRET